MSVMGSMNRFDWQGLEAVAVAQVVESVRFVRQQHPQEDIYGAMFHEFYGDGETIYWPTLTVGTEAGLTEAVADYRQHADEGDEALRDSLRWSGPDLGKYAFEANEIQEAWAARCQEFASAQGGFDAWHKIFQRFLRQFPKAARKARAVLVANKIVTRDFIAIAADEAGELIPLSLTKAQVLRHFPEYNTREPE